MEYDGEARELLLYAFEYVECQWRRNEDTVSVLGALLGLELVGTV